jgi:transcriptional regulator with XRE-family HTH domain
MGVNNVIGDRIRELRTSKNMTQNDLAHRCGLNRNSIYKYEKNETVPKVVHIEKIAAALEVTVGFLTGFGIEDSLSSPSWDADLESKLKQIGYSTGFYENDALWWINYPDGTLEVGEKDLKELHNSTNEYMRFKLEELRKKHEGDFRPDKADRK